MGFYHLPNKMLTLISLKLYTTSNCHLCEQALEIIRQLDHFQSLELVEIADDDLLLTKYATRIPVLQRTDNLLELDWPFQLSDVDRFISALHEIPASN
jgi:hypothetical protein